MICLACMVIVASVGKHMKRDQTCVSYMNYMQTGTLISTSTSQSLNKLNFDKNRILVQLPLLGNVGGTRC